VWAFLEGVDSGIMSLIFFLVRKYSFLRSEKLILSDCFFLQGVDSGIMSLIFFSGESMLS
jgi:hypothetical protein